MKVLILAEDGFEDLEFLVPYYRFKEAGLEVDIASREKGEIEGKHGYKVTANRTYEEINPDEYDMLLIPGGKSPTRVRKEEAALAITRHFMEGRKPVAAICHGPQVLISAGVIRGRHATCAYQVVDELKEAGAIYEDRKVVVDDNLVTSRMPDDLPYFLQEVMKKVKIEAVI
jgi:protease I